MNKQKLIGAIVGVLLFVAFIAGLTYAYISWTSDNINKVVNSKCFNIFYDKGTDFSGDMIPSDDYTGGVSVTVKMDIDASCNINAKGNIYLTTDATTSENLFTEGLLNYQVLINGAVTDLKGSITSSGDIVIDVGFLNKNTVATTTYTIYVWINKEYVANEHATSSFSGSVRSEAVQTTEKAPINLLNHITNLYNNAGKMQVTNNGIVYNYATSVSLMNDRLGNSDVDADSGNIRYYGANPNNYIDIGDVYTEDTITDNFNKNSLFLSLIGISDSKSCYEFFDCSLNYGAIGEIMDQTFTDEASCISGIQNYFHMTSIDDMCGTTTNKAGDPKIYRVIGLFKNVEMADGTSQDLIKVIREDSIGNLAWDLAGTSENNITSKNNNWHNATLQNILNGPYYNSEYSTHSYYERTGTGIFGAPIDFRKSGLNSNVHDKIVTVMWDLGRWNTFEIYSNQSYGYERGNIECTECTYGLPWSGKVALMYPSDYGYATDFVTCSNILGNYYEDSDCYVNDWLFSLSHGNAFEWFLTTYSSRTDVVMGVSGANAYGDDVKNGAGVRPVFYLDSELSIESGNGSKSTPFVVR